MKLINREQFISNYADAVVEDMDLKTVCQLAKELIEEDCQKLTDEELIHDISDGGYGPYAHMLEDEVIE